MQPSSNRSIYILLVLILLGVLGVLALNLGRFSPSLGTATGGSDSFFDSLNGNINGEVTRVNGDMLTIKNKKGLTRDFKASGMINIAGSMQQPGAFATPSSDLKKIEIGKPVMISVSMMPGSNQLEVNSIFPALAVGAAGIGAPPPITTPPTATRNLQAIPSEATPPAGAPKGIPTISVKP